VFFAFAWEGRVVQLEDYFELQNPEYIGVKDTRVSINVILEEFNRGVAPDKIQASFPTTTLEQVYATITYYLHNRPQLDEYLRLGRKKAEVAYQEHLQRQAPSSLAERLRTLRETAPLGSQAAS
jgi:uncharacterized protein (DUF433 family)